MTRSGLECFVRFVRLNPSLPADSELVARAFEVYDDDALFPELEVEVAA
jgi:hypothetical protein